VYVLLALMAAACLVLVLLGLGLLRVAAISDRVGSIESLFSNDVAKAAQDDVPLEPPQLKRRRADYRATG
jgi:hypothetical protein